MCYSDFQFLCRSDCSLFCSAVFLSLCLFLGLSACVFFGLSVSIQVRIGDVSVRFFLFDFCVDVTVFDRGHATLGEVLSFRPSVGLSVCLSIMIELKSGKTIVFDTYCVFLCIDGEWMPLPACPQRYCYPASVVLTSINRCPWSSVQSILGLAYR